jgi:cytochrome c-type biogenesis protein CcmH
MTASLADLRAQLQALAAQHRAGSLDEAQYTTARAPLERALADLVLAGETATPAVVETARPSRGLLATLTVGVLVIAVAGYAWKGSPTLKPAVAVAPAADPEEQAARQQIEGMVGKLAERLKEKPDDATGWLMLGRSYSVLGRNDEALGAYEKAATLRPNDATALADYADALAVKSGGRATPQSDALVARALAAEPTHLKSLALAGTSAFERGDFAGAVRHWEKMALGLPADSPDMPRLQASLDEARRRGGLAAPAAASPAPATAVAGASITGTVTLAPALAAKASPTDTVFIYARAAQGPRMPLAVIRAQVKDLPMSYKLDDSMAMSPAAKLSGAAQVVVSARISKSGNAIPQAGDLAGESSPVAPGASGVAITISAAVGS